MTVQRADVLFLTALAMDARGFATDPLTSKGEKIKSAMEKQYGEKKGESVFYASKNKGTISGVDEQEEMEGEDDKLTHPEKPERVIGRALEPARGEFASFLKRRGMSEDDTNQACDIAFGKDQSSISSTGSSMQTGGKTDQSVGMSAGADEKGPITEEIFMEAQRKGIPLTKLLLQKGWTQKEIDDEFGEE